MDEAARTIHDKEQRLAGMRHLGAGVAELFKGMIDQGMSRDDAILVASQYLRSLQSEARKRLNEGGATA